MTPTARILLLALLTMGLFAPRGATAAGDTLWDSRPYRVVMRLDLEHSGLNPAQRDRLRARLFERMEHRLGQYWKAELLSSTDPLPETGENEAPLDKELLIRVTRSAGRGVVRVVEHDLALDHRGVASVSPFATPIDLPERIYAAAQIAFRPIARFRRDPEDPKRVTLAYRAADLAPASGVGAAKPGDLLLPFRRRVDRNGETLEDGIQLVRWTYLIANPIEEGAEPNATIVSHTRRPFGSRPSARIEQLALATPVNPQIHTKLVLHALDEPETPLPGYEVLLAKQGSELREPLGFTDVRGEFTLPQRAGVWIAHVKCGTLTVASIPVAPGVDERIVAPLVDERSRLRAELEVTSLREELVDTVARRKILGERIKRLCEETNPTAATRLLNEMDELRGRTQFTRDLGVIERSVEAAHPVAKKRLTQLFDKTRTLLNTALDPREARELSRLIDRARRDAEILEQEGSAG
ncbi:hypothetical protein MalM25_20300 [Planctomycetes bacterium MalM25]|nr:hypothetical protein MalM25_20300 [Planctomycetes bacterium MalM25]